MGRYLIACVIGLLPGVAQAQSLPSPSTLVNDKGSILTINSVDGGTGKVTGNFVNNAPNTGCQGAPGFDLSGKVENNKFVFYVTFKNQTMDCHTITLWTGDIAADKISTSWELVFLNSTNGKVADGFATSTGSDLFTKQ